jgi:hypothetical protein
MSRIRPFTKEEAKALREKLGKEEYKRAYGRAYDKINHEEVREVHRARLQRQRQERDGLYPKHWVFPKSERPLKKLAYTCHDLASMTSMDRFCSVVNRVIRGELMLTYNTDETEKQKMVV